ncbi:unnamed protein product [Bemisia tabaci]|uniref:Pseudouridine-5'-phosphatase n=1 Tax=Bemisia tabaci TaxID=7038 RepID=A0A9P0F482_BEMTA|nr:unnamed protein product [Bemisia tabaci]
MANYKPVTHVIFDMDGLLLDTEKIYKQTFNEVLQNYGKEYTDDVRVKVVGCAAKDTFVIIKENTGVDVDPEQLRKEAHAKLLDRMRSAPLMPGAERLVRHLKNNNIPIAVATNSGGEEFEVVSARHKELFDLFHHIVCGSRDPEVKVGKPAPDIFFVCASRFDEKPKPEQCLVLEDSFNGVKGAYSAGMQVIMVPDPIIPPEKRTLATKVISSLNEFKPEEFGLPPFSD